MTLPLTEEGELPAGWTAASRLMLGVLLLFGLLALYLQASRWASGPDSPARLSLYSDATGKAGIEGITALPPGAFDPVAAQVSLGLSPDVRWFRVEAPPQAQGARVLVVQPSYLDDVRIYLRDPVEPAGWRLYQQGDLFPFSQRPRGDLGFSVEHGFAASEVAYVRVQTRHAHNVRIRLLDPRAAGSENARTLVVMGLYCGAVLLLALASALLAVMHRDPYWAANALFQLSTLGAMAFYFGLGSQFLLPDSPGWASQLSLWLGFVQFFFGALFYRLFFRQFGVPRWLLVLLSSLLLFLPAQALVLLTGQLDVAHRLNELLHPLAIVICVLCVALVRCDDAFLLSLLRLNAVGIGTYLVLTYATEKGWLEPGYLDLYPGVTIHLLTVVVLHLALVRRGELLSIERHSVQRKLALAHQQVQFERRQRTEDGRFLGMLLHELRSPLAVISVAQSALERRLPGWGALQDATSRDLHRIGQSVGQMRDVLQQVQAVTELEHRTGAVTADVPAHEVCDLDDLLALLARRWQGETRLRAEWAPPRAADGAPRRVAGAVSLIEMMVRNLLDNALKYSPPGSVVRCHGLFRTEPRSGVDLLVIVVANDAGPVGVPDPDKVFKKYYRAPNAHQYSGSGLGLYWVRGVARSLGGDVRFVAEAPTVCFELELPLLPE
ncbi:7TM-DISM domain-containing protein [Hydrogenophaga sp. MI9]|uniref:sensor histidine kinase n=1 Tax=Hydrogenophaga sp. MI9 TaxID=3453719 RepID=UPI003F7246F3